MNILILAREPLFSLKNMGLIKTPYRWFMVINRGGVVTNLFLTGLILIALGYFAALYLTLGAGFSIREQAGEMESLRQSVLQLEIQTQRAKTKFQEDQSPILQKMEKVSSMKYLTPTSVAASAVFGHQ